MNSLTKENFWNRLEVDSPEITKLFYKWIDAYKEWVGWKKFIPKAKFHELPVEMQMGILERFKQEYSNGRDVADMQLKTSIKKVEEWFGRINDTIKK